jgi:hypothetical protein
MWVRGMACWGGVGGVFWVVGAEVVSGYSLRKQVRWSEAVGS